MTRNGVLVLVFVVIAIAVIAVARTLIVARGDPMRRLERATPERAFAPRLSVVTEYHECRRDSARAGDVMSREACSPGDDEPPASGLFATPENSSDPVALRASALARLIWWNGEHSSLDTAVWRLSRALRLTPDRVPLLVDLSAAHLVRAEETQSPQDLYAGLQFGLEALEREPRNLSALFNAALARQLIGLDEEAARAWNVYLSADSVSPWADEARRRKRRLIPRAAPEEPDPGAAQAVVDSFAAKYPQEARELGWNRVLGEWGEAVERGDASRADSLLDFAERLGRALQRRPNGDGSLANAVSAIRAVSGDPAERMLLARGHQAYAEGQTYYSAYKTGSARKAFNAVIRIGPPSAVLLQWSRLFRAITGGHDPGTTDTTTLRRLLVEVDSARHPALEGRSRMTLGTKLFRAEEYGEARTQFQIAKHYLRRSGETELLGGALSTESETAYEQGHTVTAYALMHEAIRLLRPYRNSRWLHNHLVVMARFAVLGQMPHSALATHNEDMLVAPRTGMPILQVEALSRRALALESVGDTSGVMRDLRIAAVLAGSLQDEDARDWARATSQSGRSGPKSATAMDSAVDYFIEQKNVLWLIPALTRRADARLAAGDTAGAATDLNELTRRMRELSREQQGAALRIAIIERARGLFDKLVMLHVRQVRVGEALWALEQGRISFSPERAAGTGAMQLAAPEGHIALNYALVRDTLLTWAIRSDSIHLTYRPLDRDTFLLAVEQANAGLESGANDAASRRALERLYGWLIAPVRHRLGPRETPLVILADGEVAGVPFAALQEPEGKRYLIEDHPLRFATTLTDAFRPAPSARDQAEQVLLVAEPDFDRRYNRGMERLPGALREVDSIGTLYPGRHHRLAGASATRDAFVDYARSRSIIHYAGHAVFDDARPERSYLLLAGADSTGRLTAEAVEAMRLYSVRLVVLSACRTLPSREGRSGGFAGLSGALLTAGAEGVVGSLWKVDDELTQPLMMRFHRAYQRTGDPAAALRDAQVSMINSGIPARRSPAAWAGFRYTGGLMADPPRPSPP